MFGILENSTFSSCAKRRFCPLLSMTVNLSSNSASAEIPEAFIINLSSYETSTWVSQNTTMAFIMGGKPKPRQQSICRQMGQALKPQKHSQSICRHMKRRSRYPKATRRLLSWEESLIQGDGQFVVK